MRYGIAFDGRAPVAETLALAQAAEAHGFECAVVSAALEAGPEAVDRAIPDETADALAVAATLDDLRERLASYECAGVDLALLRLAGTPDEQLAILSALGR